MTIPQVDLTQRRYARIYMTINAAMPQEMGMATIDEQMNKRFTFTHNGRTMTTRKPFTGDAWYRVESGEYAYLFLYSDAEGVKVKDVIPTRPMFAKIA